MAVLRIPRIAAYMITNALGIVAGAAALNALVKARHTRDADAAFAVSLSPFPNFSVSINLNDILTAGGFLAAGELLLSIIAFFAYVCLLFPSIMKRTEYRKGLQAIGLGWWSFGLAWTIATAIATTVLGRNGTAKTNAYVAGVALPPATVAALQAATGLNSHYWIHGYTKFLVISAWPLIFFGIISLVLTIIAYRRTDYTAGHVEYNERAGGAYPAADNTVKSDRTSESIEEKKNGDVRMAEEP